ncbi:MAG: hypothetical protein KDD04_00045, partial [Sinomicrobium sp.]|nr:hypothetical protein [Sinomicrobium sp.]
MKTLKFYSALIIGVMLISCSSDDKIVDQVVKDTTHGAILRTISVPSATFDFFDTASVWEVELEEQDAENGALFQE